MADITDLLYADEPTAQEQARALSALLRKQQAAGMLGELTGDKTLGGFGKSLSANAQHQEDQLQAVPQTRLKMAMERLQQQSAERSAQAETDPATLGLRRSLAKKYMPDQSGAIDTAPGGSIATMLPQMEKWSQANEQIQQRRLQMQQGKYAVNPVTGQLYDTKTGQPVGGGQGGPAAGPDPLSDKRFPKMQEAFGKDMDPNAFRAGALKGNQERANAAERLLKLAVDPITGGPADLTPQQMTELSTSLASLISGGGGSEGQRHELTPYTKGRSFAGLMQWLTDEPHGADQRAFVQQMIDTANREKGVVEGQIKQAQGQRLANHLQYLGTFPEQAKSQMSNYGINPADVDFKTGKYSPKTKNSANSPTGDPAALRKKYGL